MSVNVENNMIHVVFAADANYVMPLAVAICSTASNCNRNHKLFFHVIQSGIGKELQRKVESSLARTNFPDARINWLDAQFELIKNFKLGHRYTTALTFARLQIPELLPVEVQKALYLDCDIVVREDIAELWDMNFGDNSVLAARDTVDSVGNPVGGIANYRELNMPANTKYFNAGVLLMNLQKWREKEITSKLFHYLTTHHDVIRMADQEALNVVLFGDWGELDYSWNWQIVWRGFRRGTHQMSWIPETKRKRIVHFITDEKPWLPGCDYDEKQYFFEYLDKTEWAGWRVPWVRELYGRSRRAFGDIRNAQGRLRRKICARTVELLK